MLGTIKHPIRDAVVPLIVLAILVVAAWIAVDYGFAIAVALIGVLIYGAAIPFAAMYLEEHDPRPR